ncbi:hypothetical protein AAW01_02850 [Aurantiacibacter gangjinensis]|uniref:Uncharacterized protein n=2 Tax=Aurantiacibacter gangjinensis TaxID=502682 RepID=A0A0G9MQF5_9SPHN|nr:hypothetical protein AAW01_02850 [Aurantiacibacter gangjinensis]
MKYQVITTPHALTGIIGNDDSLLVLQPGLLPESRAALDLLKAEGDRLLVVSAGPGVAAGLERIDLDRAWAGALTVPGKWLGRLTALPEDAAPQNALLRIALQQRLPEARLADSTLDDGRWTVVTSAETAQALATGWQRAHLGDVPAGAASRWLAKQAVSSAGTILLTKRYSRLLIGMTVVALLAGGIACGVYEMPALGFLLIALSVPLLEVFLTLSRLMAAPFGTIGKWPWARRAVDAALLAVSIISIDSLPHRTVFPAIVLVAALVLLDRRQPTLWLEPLRDRMVIAGFIAIIAALAMPELAIMLAGMLVLLANLAPDRS